MPKRALVLGAGGFIGSHMVTRLVDEGYYIVGVDVKDPEFSKSRARHFVIQDLRNREAVWNIISQGQFDEIYQFAADMGGAGYVFTGDHDADIMRNSVQINLNVIQGVFRLTNPPKIFYSSSACMYPEYNQLDPNDPNCKEDSAYPADPDSEYGWEKLFSERLYLASNRNYKIPVRIARYHNIFGPEGTWQGGKEKAPAAICRKLTEVNPACISSSIVEIWGDGKQTRSFLYIDECIEATRRLMESDFIGPVNIGSEEMVTINQLVGLVAKTSKKNITVKHIDGPLGVRGRNSDNTLLREKLGWAPSQSLEEGIRKTYEWIESQV